MKSLCVCVVLLVLLHFIDPSYGFDDSPIIVNLDSVGCTGLYKRNYVLSENTTRIMLLGLNENCSFLILQVHSYIERVTLSYSNTIEYSRHVNGTNIGLYWGKNMQSNFTSRSMVFYIKRFKQYDKLLNILLIINTYEYNDPIPGGCNTSFETEVAPYQKVVYDSNSIHVSAQAPSTYRGLFPNCDPTNISTVHYYMFINGLSGINEDLYFSVIKKMITIKDIYKYGIPVSENMEFLKFKQQYSIIKGTGYLFTLVSTLRNRTSIYVPSISFGCDISNWEEDCIEYDTHWKIMYSVLIICGTFICLFGHLFFTYSIFLCSLALGTSIVYSVIEYIVPVNGSSLGKWVFALFIGLCSGILLLLCYKRFKKPLCAVQGIFLLLGFIFATFCVFGIGVSSKSNENIELVVLFVLIWILCPVLLSISPHYGFVTALSFVGSFGFVYGLSAFAKSSFQYIFVNGLKALAARDTIIAVPIDQIDILMIFLLILFFGMGCAIQIRQLKGKSWFPVIEEDLIGEVLDNTADIAEEHQTTTVPNETSPLLTGNHQLRNNYFFKFLQFLNPR